MAKSCDANASVSDMANMANMKIGRADFNSNIVNNGRFIGHRMRLTEKNKNCCPPPLFHCFGLVLGLLACITHGAALVLPSQTFEPKAVLEALMEEKCTGLHGVPTMFKAALNELEKKPSRESLRLRTGIAA